MKAKKTSTVAFIALIILLEGCTTAPSNKIEPTTATSPSSANIENTKATTESPALPLAPCVYESTKGVAEVIELTPQQVTFKFYPGDQVFTLPANALNKANIELDQELKAIIRTPLSGPCEKTEFELLSTVE